MSNYYKSKKSEKHEDLAKRTWWITFPLRVCMFLFYPLIAYALYEIYVYDRNEFVTSATAFFCLYLVLYYFYKLNTGLKLYYDKAGVWCFSGVFPWQKGVKGVKWRDIESAHYENTFFSWLFSCYTITIENRFKPELNINLKFIGNGKAAIENINEILEHYSSARNEDLAYE